MYIEFYSKNTLTHYILITDDEAINIIEYNKRNDNKYIKPLVNTESNNNQYQLTKTENILENSLFSFLDNPYNIKLNPKYELPWVDAENYPKYGRDQDIYEPQFNDSSINLISETNDNNHEVFITEKLWKPIIAGQVFVVHGNYQYLKQLKNMGFKTFGQYFNESYDDEQNPDKRIDCIVSLCKELKNIDILKLYRETETIRQHNRNLFFNDAALTNAIKETLSVFFKFADCS
jgi:hypothetical protein